jgi:hypothetical protein
MYYNNRYFPFRCRLFLRIHERVFEGHALIVFSPDKPPAAKEQVVCRRVANPRVKRIYCVYEISVFQENVRYAAGNIDA